MTRDPMTAPGRGCVKTPTRFFKMGSGYWLTDKASPPVLPATANGLNSRVEVGNIFVETQIFAFLHSLGRLQTLHPSESDRPRPTPLYPSGPSKACERIEVGMEGGRAAGRLDLKPVPNSLSELLLCGA